MQEGRGCGRVMYTVKVFNPLPPSTGRIPAFMSHILHLADFFLSEISKTPNLYIENIKTEMFSKALPM
jgi:hypothetical protein